MQTLWFAELNRCCITGFYRHAVRRISARTRERDMLKDDLDHADFWSSSESIAATAGRNSSSTVSMSMCRPAV